MFPNSKGSEELSILATIDPISQGAGTVSTAWINVVNFHAFLAVVQTGVMGAAATLDAKVQQAQDNAGTGVKDVTGKAIVQILKIESDYRPLYSERSGEICHDIWLGIGTCLRIGNLVLKPSFL